MVFESDMDDDFQSIQKDVFSPTSSARASISSISSPRSCSKNYNALVPCISSSDQQLKAKELLVESSEEYVVGEVSKNGGTLFLASKEGDSHLKSDDPRIEVKKPVFVDEISIVCVDESGKGNETGVLDNCGLLPNACLPCLASTVSSVDKRRPLSPSNPTRRKPALKLSFKWREGHATPPLLASEKKEVSASVRLLNKVIGIVEDEDWPSSSGRASAMEIYLQDAINEEEPYYTSGSISKLQFRKDVSQAIWNDEMGMAEVVEKKGKMWTTTGIVRNGKTYCSIEETLFLAELGALHVLDDNDTSISLKGIYDKIAQGKCGCCWESFEVYRHLKSLAYIVGQHGIPWTSKGIKTGLNSHHGTLESNSMTDEESEEKSSITELVNGLHLTEVKPAFDVYLPNSKFRKSSPGDPSFVLFLASGCPPTKSEIEDLERQCGGVPFKFCHVAHGRVSFFSVNGVKLPVLP